MISIEGERKAAGPGPDASSPPYSSYAAIVATFVGGLGVTGAVASSLGRKPQAQTTLDFVLLAAATFRAVRFGDRTSGMRSVGHAGVRWAALFIGPNGGVTRSTCVTAR